MKHSVGCGAKQQLQPVATVAAYDDQVCPLGFGDAYDFPFGNTDFYELRNFGNAVFGDQVLQLFSGLFSQPLIQFQVFRQWDVSCINRTGVFDYMEQSKTGTVHSGNLQGFIEHQVTFRRKIDSDQDLLIV